MGTIRKDRLSNTNSKWQRENETARAREERKSDKQMNCGKETARQRESKWAVIYSGGSSDGADAKGGRDTNEETERKSGVPSGRQGTARRQRGADEKRWQASKSRVCRSRSPLIIRAQSLSYTHKSGSRHRWLWRQYCHVDEASAVFFIGLRGSMKKDIQCKKKRTIFLGLLSK